MNVLFISPHYPLEMQDFTRGLAEVGARVYGLADIDRHALPEKVRRYLSGYVRVPRLGDHDTVVSAIRSEFAGVAFDRIECMWEPCVLLAAALRETFSVAGMNVDTIRGFRDKAIMKERLVAAGLRVPRYARVRSAAGARQAAEDIGFPLVAKPISGAGTAHTHGLADSGELERYLERTRHVPELSIEEYIDGDEFTYDAVVIAGRPVFESVAQYFPKPLESRNIEWISPAQLVFRDPRSPGLCGGADLGPGIELGRGALEALSMGTGFVHMEWFRKRDGEVVFGEIAARNGGAKLMDQINFANDFDVYREWARAVCWHSFDAEPGRRYHVAVVFKRARGNGRITRIEGMDALRSLCGAGLVLDHLLPVGRPRRDWKATLLSDGYVLLRDPDYRRCMDMMHAAVTEVKMYAG